MPPSGASGPHVPGRRTEQPFFESKVVGRSGLPFAAGVDVRSGVACSLVNGVATEELALQASAKRAKGASGIRIVVE